MTELIMDFGNWQLYDEHPESNAAGESDQRDECYCRIYLFGIIEAMRAKGMDVTAENLAVELNGTHVHELCHMNGLTKFFSPNQVLEWQKQSFGIDIFDGNVGDLSELCANAAEYVLTGRLTFLAWFQYIGETLKSVPIIDIGTTLK